jgi:protein gp37
LFHKSIPASFVVSVFEVMSAATQHTFLVLTKRPERIKSVLFGEEGRWYFGSGDYLPNVWLGVSVEDQKTADERIPLLLQTPAAVRFVSYEPALGPLDLRVFDNQKGLDYSVFKNARALIPDWVIAGGESGPSPRPADIAWFRQVRDQCQAADMPFFMKQIITNGKKIPWEQFPEDLRIRQFPDKESA